jgi:L-ascorbate metabolism protein UlaG (beta-lactamase superfamily)
MIHLLSVIAFVFLAFPAFGQDATRFASQCMAVAQQMPDTLRSFVIPASLTKVAAPTSGEVKITYAGHSTFVIESTAGVRIATDFSGAYGSEFQPRVITMNKAHRTHYTDTPDPVIEHVLRGWNPQGGPAEHRLVVDDVFIRNVSTDIRGNGMMEADGNSIFIFEVADLCIGHLGHLHHMLTDEDYGAIGRLDVVMVPVDGGLTLSHQGMSEIVKRLRASIVLPMHRRFTPASDFLARVSGEFDVRYPGSREIMVSLKTLPSRPTIMVLEGL